MPLIALTGGIASGTSTIARRLASHGAILVDADQIVRDVQAPGNP
ncbi:MAG: dephospho-CoA kinase, partial [Microbacterium sp.]|nr:dephospho-CoA kinase [Microbacterium sp.]